MRELRWIEDDIALIDEFLSEEECQSYITWTESQGYDIAPITTLIGPMVSPNVRNNTRVMVDDSKKAAELWEKLKDVLPATYFGLPAIGLNERLRFYRYEVGQRFNWHRDGHFERDNGERSQMTFMVYLNEDFEGGETDFQDISVKPKQGQAILFHHPLLHRGARVTEGRKYVLRTDVMYDNSVPYFVS